jgi:hypothetical protein
MVHLPRTDLSVVVYVIAPSRINGPSQILPFPLPENHNQMKKKNNNGKRKSDNQNLREKYGGPSRSIATVKGIKAHEPILTMLAHF